MSFRLPSVIVYQQLVSTTVSPTTPFMDLCVVGPVYQCENGTALSDYEVHLTEKYVKTFPNLKAGAIVSEDSVFLTVSDVNVKVWPINNSIRGLVTMDNTGPATCIKSFTGTGGLALEAAEIEAGDEVDFYYQDGVDKLGNPIYKVKTAKIYEIVYVKDAAGKDTDTIDHYVLQKNVLTTLFPTTTDIKATVKRKIEDSCIVYPDKENDDKTEADPKGFYIDHKPITNDPLLVITIGGLQVPVDDEALVTTTVVDCKVKVTYRALRTDIANDFITISSYDDALAQFGKPNIENPMSIAAQIISTAVGNLTYKVLPIASDDLVGYTQAVDILSNNEKVYIIEPLMIGLTREVQQQVVQLYTNHCKAMSEALKSKWRIIYANMPMPATKVVVELNNGTLQTMGSETENMLKETFSNSDPRWDDTNPNESVLKLATLKYTQFLGLYDSDTGKRLAPTGGTWGSYELSPDRCLVVIKVAPNKKFNGYAYFEDPDFNYDEATCYVKDEDTNIGGFITNMARATDYVDLYKITGSGASKKIKYSYSLMIKKVETDSSCICYTQKWVRTGDSYEPVENEYQHFVPELKDKGELPDFTKCGYEVARVLDTAGMAEAMSAVAQSYKTKRLRYVQPDQIIITVNGTNYTVSGQYLCVALGAMRAGLPPHQGFSTMGISGITRILRSNKMFSEDQLAEMAGNGVLWVAQDYVDALPYVLYQTTTDTTQLETAEDSIVAIVDYASKFYKDNLKDVLGVYNVNTISLNYVKTVINACSNEMTSTTYEKIGPILTSAVLTSLVADGDKIKPTIKVGVPYPVNGVDVTLVV